MDRNATNLAELQKNKDQYCHDVEEFCAGINQRLGKNVLCVVPVGEASIALREKIVAGQAPGLKQQSELFNDDWRHPKLPLQILDSYCHFAVIYRRGPVGLPIPPELNRMKDVNAEEKDKLNRLLQQLAWDTVTHHPMTGLSAPPVH
ncbi:MAG TPA: hypothetical protein VHZ24_19785 [Pirellulales bacterium]|nr:hypothetical protein [Pirellulales bacterium]